MNRRATVFVDQAVSSWRKRKLNRCHETLRLSQIRTGKNILDDEENQRLIREKLPTQYTEFIDVFSDIASDVLPSHRERVDNKIKLIGPESTLTCNNLYKLSEWELQATKM